MKSEDLDSMEVWEVGIVGQEHRCILGDWESLDTFYIIVCLAQLLNCQLSMWESRDMPLCLNVCMKLQALVSSLSSG